ncbi:MAG: VCBS domain-containing protein, partial [Pseudomonadota bacterium]
MSNIPNFGIVTFDTSETVVIDAAVDLPPIDNSALLFQGNYSRSGADLVISHSEFGSLRIQNYFVQPDPQNLLSVDGGLVDGKTAMQLAGPLAAGQYAQVGSGPAATPIGTVQTAVGTATAQRTDGTSVTLSVGDPVFQGDVVQTAAGSSLVIVFVDETLFSLSAEARMVLDELIYTPNGAGNSMVMNLVQGSFVFVTGQVAPTGNMRVETPTATMGIRGTTPIVQIDAVDGSTRFSLSLDPDGRQGLYQLFDRITGQLLGTVDTTDSTFLVASVGATPIVTPKTQSDLDAEQGELQQAFDAYRAAGLGQSPGNDGNDGDGDPGQTDAGPPEGIESPELSPLEPEGESDNGADSQDESGLELLNPSDPASSSSTQFAGRSSTQTQLVEEEEQPVDDDLSVVFPTNVVTSEDEAINLTGFTVEIPGDGEGTVTIVARSTVTLAQVDGLTFTNGDGFDDEEMTFSGSEEDINAALAGMQYTPSPDSVDGGLNITVDDGSSTVEADVPITIEPVEDPPVVFDLSLEVNEDGSVTAPFIGSDPDEGDTITLYSLTDPELGTLIVHDDGTFTFDTAGDFETLSANSTQQVTFEYTAVDSTGRVSTSSGLVTITVTGVNDDPEIDADGPAGFAEAANASSQRLVDSGAISASDVDQGGSVSVIFSTDGAPVWSGGNLDDISPDLAAILLAGFTVVEGESGFLWNYDAIADLDFLSANETITFSYTITAEDNFGGTDTDQVTFVITGTEDAPVISGELAGDVAEDGVLTASGALTATDADAVDTATFVPQTGVSGTYGTFDLAASGEWTYVLDNDAAQTLSGGEIFEETFTVAATTADGESVTQTVTVTVTGQEDAPVISGNASGATEEDGIASASGTLSVSDADAADTPTFTAQSGTAGLYGTFEVNAAGLWTYTLDNAAAQVLAGGEEFEEVFTVEATTEDGELVTQDVTITVTGEEDGPVITGDATGEVEEDNIFSATGTLSVSDADAVDNPSFTPQEGTAGIYGTFEVNAAGLWTYTLDNAAAQVLAGGEEFEEVFTVEATTEDGEVVTQDVTITVTGEEDGPVITGDAVGEVEEDAETLTTSGTLNVSDADGNDDPAFTPQEGTAGIYGTFEVNAAGLWSYTLDNAAAQVLAGGEEFVEIFTVEATTEDGEVVTQDVTITVTGEEDGPVIAGESSGEVEEDNVFSATGTLSVSDADAVDNPTFTPQEGTAGIYGTFEVNAAGLWIYSLDNAAAQVLAGGEEFEEVFTVEATTEDGELVTQDVTITVTGEEDGPVIIGDAIGEVEEDAEILTTSGTLNVSDADGNDDPTFTPQEGTAGTYGTFEVNAAGLWTYTLDNAAAQVLAGGEEFQEVFTVEATTEDGEVVTQDVTITVTGEEDGPIIAGESSGEVEEDNVFSATGTLSASDADAVDNPTFTPQEGTAGTYGTFEVNAAGLWIYTLDNAAAQVLAGGEEFQEVFTVQATTEDGEVVTQDVTITVTGEEDGPVITGDAAGDAEGDVTEDAEVLTTSGTLNVSDADGNDDPTFTPQEGTAGVYGTFEVNAAGLWIYTLDNAAAQVLAGGEEFEEVFTVEATTEDGEVVTQDVTVTVTGEEDGPVIAGESSGEVEEDTVFSATGTLSVSDADGNDDPTFTPQEGTSGIYGTFEVNAAGLWTYTLDNVAAQVLAGGEEFEEVFTVEATTEDGEVVTQDVTITVTGEEDGPVITGDAEGSVTEDAEVLTTSGTLSVSDTDGNDNPTFTPQEGTAGTYGTFEVNAAGLWTYTLDNAAAQVLAGGEEFEEVFTVEATTEDGEVVTQDVTITVTGEE